MVVARQKPDCFCPRRLAVSVNSQQAWLLAAILLAIICWQNLLYAIPVEHERFFSWAEQQYPQYLSPANGEPFQYQNYWVKSYQDGDLYLGLLDREVYAYGKITSYQLLYLGRIDDFISSPLFDPNAAPITEGSWYRPSVSSSWQWQLQGELNDSYPVAVYDIDLFNSDVQLIQSLQQKGIRVICYFSAGSWESWRPDSDSFSQELLGNTLDEWPDEKWLDIRNEELATIMRKRLDLAVEKSCDGVEPDLLDAYRNPSGFALTQTDQLAYNKFIANEAHKRGLAVALKNDLDQIVQLHSYFDFAVNEQCHYYDECDKLVPFIQAQKPVFNAEYHTDYIHDAAKRNSICETSRQLGLSTLILPLELDDSFRYSCL